MNAKAYLGEAFGTFVLVFCGCGAAVLAGPQIGYAGVSAAFGLALLTMVYAVGPVSGCHLNPAVTLGLWMSGKFDARLAPGYVFAQLFGSLLASGILFVIAHGTGHFDASVSGFATNGFGIHSPDRYDATSAFIIEFLLTGFLMLTILGTTDIRTCPVMHLTKMHDGRSDWRPQASSSTRR